MQTEMSGKYNSPFFFSITSPTVRINLLFLILKFGIKDFTDHLSRSTKVPADPHWFVVVVVHAFTRVSLKKQTAGIYN